MIKIDDDFLGLNQEVRQDINMNLPGVDPAGVAELGRITINFMNDGSLTGKDGEILATDDEIKGYIEGQRDGLLKLGKKPVLFVRGEKETVLRTSRRVIRLGADAGVTQVFFGTYPEPGE